MANEAQSIVDFLKSKGFTPTQGDKFPFFDLRKDLFSRIGGQGNFIGSAQQNVALLQGLESAEKNVGVKITPNNIRDIIGAGGTSHGSHLTGIMEGVADVAAQTQALQERIKTEGITGAGGRLLLPPTTPEGIAVADGATLSSQAEPTLGTEETTPTDLLPEPVSGAGVLPEIPSPQDLASMALEQIQTGATFPLQLEAQQAAKGAVQLGAQRETEQFITNIASRGLFFSGAKAAGVSQIEADKLSELLNIDRRFALLIVQGLQTSAQQIAKEAQKGRQEAIESLEALGFAINPATGNIEPTLAARKAVVTEERLARTEERLTVAEERQQQQFQFQQEQVAFQRELDAAKFDLSIAKSTEAIRQAQERISVSEANLRLAQQKEARLAAGLGGLEISTSVFMEPQLASEAGPDGKVSPDTWKRLKAQWRGIGLQSENFIKRFSDFINPFHPGGVIEYGVREANYVREIGTTGAKGIEDLIEK